MGVITLKIDDDIEDKLRRKVGRDRGVARGAISSSVEEAITAWLQEDYASEQTQTRRSSYQPRPAVRRYYIAKKGDNDETLAEANTLETLSTKIRELGINPRSIIIESVPSSPPTRRMGLRITGRKPEAKN